MDSMFDKYFERCCVLAGKVFLKDGHHMNIIGFGWDTSGHTAIMGFPEYSDEIRNDLTNVLKKALNESRDNTGAEGQPDWYVQTAETRTLKVKTIEEYAGFTSWFVGTMKSGQLKVQQHSRRQTGKNY